MSAKTKVTHYDLRNANSEEHGKRVALGRNGVKTAEICYDPYFNRCSIYYWMGPETATMSTVAILRIKKIHPKNNPA